MPTIEDFKELYIGVLIGIIIMLIGLTLIATATEDRAVQCNYCHQKLSIQVDDPDCESCHAVVRNQEAHQAQVCHVCHNISDPKSYHQAHNVTCGTCHPTGKLPPKTYSDCLSCHTSLHNIHNNCIMCHPPTNSKVKAETVFKPFSLYDIILKLLKGLSWIK